MKSTEFDIETTGISPFKYDLCSMQLGDQFMDHYPHIMSAMPEEIGDVLEDINTEKIIFNAHFEYLWILVKTGVRIKNFQCAQLAAFLTLMRAEVKKEKKSFMSHALKPLSQKYLGAEAAEFEKFKKYGGIQHVTRHLYLGESIRGAKGITKEQLYKDFVKYSLDDNKYGRGIWEYATSLPEWKIIKPVYDQEIKLIPIIADMETVGLWCDRKGIENRIEEMEPMIEESKKRLYTMVGEEFDLHGKNVGDLLKSKCNIPLTRMTKDGHYKSDSKESLPRFMNHDVVRELVSCRKMLWVRTTCLERWLKEGNPVRTSINSMGAVHGRFSSSDPNLMNVPKRDSDLRRFFVPRPGFDLYMFDWSQIELVIAAYYSQDPAFLKSFRNNEDAHAQTAAEMFDKKVEDVTKEERSDCKEDGFGILYGSGYRAIAERIVNKRKIPYIEALKMAKDIYKRWYKVHHGIRSLNKNVMDILLTDDEQIKEHEASMNRLSKAGQKTWSFNHTRKYKHRGFLISLFKRLWKPERPSHHYKGAEALISGTATGDMPKISMIKIYELLKDKESRLLLPYHDEVILEIKHGEELELVPNIKAIMEDFPEIQKVVPVKVDIDYSTKNWYESEPVYDSKTNKWFGKFGGNND